MIPARRDGTVAEIPPVVQILLSVYMIPFPSRLGEIPASAAGISFKRDEKFHINTQSRLSGMNFDF